MKQKTQQPINRQYRANDLAEALGVSRSTIWRWNSLKLMPTARRLGPGVTVWDGSEIEEWLAARADQA